MAEWAVLHPRGLRTLARALSPATGPSATLASGEDSEQKQGVGGGEPTLWPECWGLSLAVYV